MNFTSAPVGLLIFLLTISISLYTIYKNERLLYSWILRPNLVYYHKQYYLIITSGFIHADLMHLLFNMFTFYFFGFRLEQSIGSLNFTIIYFGSMIISNISTIIKKRNIENYGSLGASGAISGILFASILINPNASIMIMPIPIPIPSYIYAVLFLLWSYFASKKSMDTINHEAHLWGAISGLVLLILLIPEVIPYFINQIF